MIMNRYLMYLMYNIFCLFTQIKIIFSIFLIVYFLIYTWERLVKCNYAFIKAPIHIFIKTLFFLHFEPLWKYTIKI